MSSRRDLSDIAGPASMGPKHAVSSHPVSPSHVSSDEAGNTRNPPGSSSSRRGMQGQGQSSRGTNMVDEPLTTTKKKRHRAGKKRRNRRQSFIAPSDTTMTELDVDQRPRPSLLDANRTSTAQASFYRLKSSARSNTSLESEALLDHRDQQPIRNRRQSIQPSMYAHNARMPFHVRQSTAAHHRPSHPSVSAPADVNKPSSPMRTRQNYLRRPSLDDAAVEEDDANDRTPLLSNSRPSTSRNASHMDPFHFRRKSVTPSGKSGSASVASRKARPGTADSDDEDYDVNNPPSIPGSPKLGTIDDVMIAEQFSSNARRSSSTRDAIIDIDRHSGSDHYPSAPSSDNGGRRRTVQNLAENDVCYPRDDESDIGEEPFPRPDQADRRSRRRRRRRRQWPDLSVLDDWSREEKEERDQENIRAKKISEPVLVGGRLRPIKTVWHREEDDAPYRYTYFNETLDGTIHSRTISELCQFGANFKELFVPEGPELSDDSESEDGQGHSPPVPGPIPAHTSSSDALSTHLSRMATNVQDTRDNSGTLTPAHSHTPQHQQEDPQKRYGPRPTFWLDVLSPTETEMKVLSKAFGIHQLTTEDILMQEPREKVELFQSYYFVNYRSFEQDKDSEDYMEPVNMYVVVFREGVISFHFSMTPHPANVRRRIRQLNDYMSPSADWISYAIIDDVTDVYAPLVQQIEDEVDEIDDAILRLHSAHEHAEEKPKKSAKAKELEYEKSNKGTSDTRSEKGEPAAGDNGGDMLRRVGECRKKVMTLYRLLGNKADVIKGFAKRCNEHWEVAPRSEIGLYLGDIQDHIVTMTGNLSHYENLLSRAHSNYLAQINIRMNERAEQTNDVLGKLTVLGTIVLPMNIVTGMWGMNVMVPGQEVESLTWFWCLAGGLLAFGLVCYSIARRIYGIV